MQVVFDEVVGTDYGQFDLVWGNSSGFDGDWDRHFSGQLNGLVGTASGEGIYVNLARRSGGSSVRIVVAVDAPPVDDQLWEDVVEVSATIPSAVPLGWSSWAGASGGPLDIAPGDYRVRVSARGRDAGKDGEFADGIVDFYLIELWPAAHRPDAIVKTTSADALYWHKEVGSRR